MNTLQFLLEIPELQFDRDQLLEIFEQAKPYARLKGLVWKEKPKWLPPLDKATCLVIQSGEYMMLDKDKANMGYNLLQHDYLKDIMKRLRFSHEIKSGNIDIIWYRPGFQFEPHVDHYAAATMMWPIFPASGGAPIDFYYNENVKIEAGVAAGLEGIITKKDLIHTHYYNTTYPTIFNSHWIHGVRRVTEERAYLRLRINESFESIVNKYNNKELVE
jgi:hypothetical protein